MKKIFTFVLATLASLAINAEVAGHWQFSGGDAPAVGSFEEGTNLKVEFLTSDDSKSFSNESVAYNEAVPETMMSLGKKGIKMGANALYLKVTSPDGFVAGDVITICGYNKWKISSSTAHSGDVAATVETGSSKTDYNLGTFTLAEDVDELYFMRAESTGTCICAIHVDRNGTPSTDPRLSVSTAEVKLEATAAEPTDEAKITFSGKNLAAGTYDLAIPSIAGLTVNPTSVTVGEDGKLSQEITLSYAPEEEAAGFADLSLTIGELTAKTEIIYNATFEKRYLLFSLNIEQWVLDNGKRTNDFLMALGNAGWDYANVNELDSLNDEKSARNEPYLGLKLKTAGAYVAGWLRANETINLKFGYVGDDVIINGATIAKADLEQPIQLTVDQDTYIKIETTTKNTVVLKQLMLNDPIADVVLPDSPQGLQSTNAAVNTVKILRDGQVLILKNGTLYNAQGTIVQ